MDENLTKENTMFNKITPSFQKHHLFLYIIILQFIETIILSGFYIQANLSNMVSGHVSNSAIMYQISPFYYLGIFIYLVITGLLIVLYYVIHKSESLFIIILTFIMTGIFKMVLITYLILTDSILAIFPEIFLAVILILFAVSIIYKEPKKWFIYSFAVFFVLYIISFLITIYVSVIYLRTYPYLIWNSTLYNSQYQTYIFIFLYYHAYQIVTLFLQIFWILLFFSVGDYLKSNKPSAIS